LDLVVLADRPVPHGDWGKHRIISINNPHNLPHYLIWCSMPLSTDVYVRPMVKQ
jgi:hypothetical protein